MINSLNAAISDEQLDLFMQELEERDEMLCFLNACAVAFNPCVGAACAVACVGISACLVGVHIS